MQHEDHFFFALKRGTNYDSSKKESSQ